MKFLSKTLYLFLLTLCSVTAFSQTDWQWGQEVRSNAFHITTDAEGNTYVTWSLEDAYTLDDETFFSNGVHDAALTSFDCDGAHRWTKIIGGTSGDSSWGLATDSLNGVYLLCNVNSSRLVNYELNLDSDTSVISNRKGILLIKYNTDGELQWFKMPEDTVVVNPSDLQLAVALDLFVSPQGDSYVYSKLPMGTYCDESFEATFPGSVNDGEDIYMLKYNTEGTFIGADHLGLYYDGSLFAKSEIIRDYHTGRYYLAGNRNDDDVFIFGGEEVTANNYLVQFDQDGNVNWTISFDDSDSPQTGFRGKPVVDEMGNVYLTGYSYDGNSIGDFTFQNSIGSSGFPIVAKIDAEGNVVFASNASGNAAFSGHAITYFNGKVAVTGQWGELFSWGDVTGDITDENSQGYNVFLTIFDANEDELTPESFHTLSSPPLGVERSSLITHDPQGNLYVGGQFTSQMYVGDMTLYNQSGTNEGYIAKFGTDTCYCPLPEAAFAIDSIATQAEYIFAYTGTAEVDSVVWDFGDGTTATELNLEHLFTESGEYTVCVTAYNECGPDSSCITLNALGPVGVRTVDGYAEIAIYPNPARDILTIDNPTPGIRVDIFNSVGQHIQSEILQHSPAQIDVSSLETGFI